MAGEPSQRRPVDSPRSGELPSGQTRSTPSAVSPCERSVFRPSPYAIHRTLSRTTAVTAMPGVPRPLGGPHQIRLLLDDRHGPKPHLRGPGPHRVRSGPGPSVAGAAGGADPTSVSIKGTAHSRDHPISRAQWPSCGVLSPARVRFRFGLGVMGGRVPEPADPITRVLSRHSPDRPGRPAGPGVGRRGHRPGGP